MEFIDKVPYSMQINEKLDDDSKYKLSGINKFPTNSKNEFVEDIHVIIAYIISCMDIEIITDTGSTEATNKKKLNFKFPEWFLNSTLSSKSIRELRQIIELQLNSKFEENSTEIFVKTILDFKIENINQLYEREQIIMKENNKRSNQDISEEDANEPNKIMQKVYNINKKVKQI